ncbi:hypothetical protein DU504_07425 [Haloplanus salinus]|uniref:Uncharacterized protein n=1 Tax=Haloplanus salinus TaxID=1126245 RepID=A0A368NC22_9EURY|nr:hypothetical protein DU504_07425 [Haloplanus salinus]
MGTVGRRSNCVGVGRPAAGSVAGERLLTGRAVVRAEFEFERLVVELVEELVVRDVLALDPSRLDVAHGACVQNGHDLTRVGSALEVRSRQCGDRFVGSREVVRIHRRSDTTRLPY